MTNSPLLDLTTRLQLTSANTKSTFSFPLHSLLANFRRSNLHLVKVHSLSSSKGKVFLCAACHAFTPHVNAWKNSISIVVQVQARG